MIKKLLSAAVASILIGCGSGGSYTDEPIVTKSIKAENITEVYNAIVANTSVRVEYPSGTYLLQFDQQGKLIYNNRNKITNCPRDAEVWFISGQSNAANSSNALSNFSPNAKVFQFHNGVCFTSNSPLFGATGWGYNPYEQVASEYSNRTGKNVVISFFAIGGKSITSFAPGGEYSNDLYSRMLKLDTVYNIDRFIWHQGESDANMTNPETYRQHFENMVAPMRGRVKNVHVVQSTLCGDIAGTNPIATVQSVMQVKYPGPNSDIIVGDLARYDGCHYSAQGVTLLSNQWQFKLQGLN